MAENGKVPKSAPATPDNQAAGRPVVVRPGTGARSRGLGRWFEASADRGAVSLSRLTQALGVTVAVVGALIVLGWALGEIIIPSANPASPAVRFNTGICLTLAGVGLVLAGTGRHVLASRLLGAAVAAIATLTLFEYVFATDLGIDQVVFDDGSISVGSMAPNTAAAFLLCGLALLLAPSRPGRWQPSEALALGGALIGWIALIGFAADLDQLLRLADYLIIALPTAICFILLGTGIALAAPDGLLAGLVASRGPAGSLVRRMLVAVVVVPPLIALGLRTARSVSLIDEGTAILLLVGLVVVALLIVALSFARPLDEAEASRLKAEEASHRLGAIVEHTDDAVLTETREGVISTWNRAAERLYGYTADEAIGKNVAMLMPPERTGEVEKIIGRVYRGEAMEQYETERIRRDGSRVDVAVTFSPIRNQSGKIDAVSAIARDISERKRHEGQLQYLADHDPLTGLFNRRRFQEELEREVARAERYEMSGAVLALDLDHFKYVNDSFGHATGDELIARVGELLRSRLRETDVLARVGGDEFAVILPGVDEAQARQVSVSVLDDIRADDRLAFPGGPKHVTASIGIAPFGAGEEVTAEELLVEADIAMYDAKDAGRARASVYSLAEGRHERMTARLTWVERIQDALANDGFVLHAQPILALDGDPVPRHELLLRMVDEDGELIPPDTFLYIAERLELMQEIDRWVVREAVGIAAHEQAAGADVRLELNLSAASVGRGDLAAVVRDEIEAAGADGSGLCFEMTETAAIVNVEGVKRFARQVGELGCEFALDDFGSGFASFYYLKHLPFDYLKIDGEFIRDLSRSSTDRLMVRSLVEIANGLGKRTIAEFVGDQEALELLRRYGVDYAQGFFVGEPASLAETDLARPAEVPA